MMDRIEAAHPTAQLLSAAPALLEACELALFYLAPYATGRSELHAARLLRDVVLQARGPVRAHPPLLAPSTEELQ
jgi:hypothetical protein